MEAKSERKHPLSAKEQARKYARSQNARFVILSNGNIHYLWDLRQGDPAIITKFPSPVEIGNRYSFQPDVRRLVNEQVDSDYIATTQMPGYMDEAGWKNDSERASFIEKSKLHFLRKYQRNAIHRLQKDASDGSDRFLFEMATGTGKTLTSAAVIKLFLRTENAKRVLFLVDRLELENQASRAFKTYLKNDFTSVIYKEQKDDWRKAEIVITTVQSLLFNDKYKRLFSPSDFDLVISDEAHRSIGGNARAVFEYFVGYKLGLTATPKDYLKKSKKQVRKHDPREIERRMMLDTYRTFGCSSGTPTFRYSLIDGVKDDILVNPYVIDVRTNITTQLLSDNGLAIGEDDSNDNNLNEIFVGKDFEKNFFSEPTNRAFCEALLEYGIKDPISGEFGKTIVFTVSQDHASKVTQILNEMSNKIWPRRYKSDFAIQISSDVEDAQAMAVKFANNNLGGHSVFRETYRTSKSRVCVTVRMMTTGYDCPDILNLALMRPVFSPSEFIQIKGRGTRKHNFSTNVIESTKRTAAESAEKRSYRLFDFFANYEYFEKKYNYDSELSLPISVVTKGTHHNDEYKYRSGTITSTYENFNPDKIASTTETKIGKDGMKVDKKMFNKFESVIKNDQKVKMLVKTKSWECAVEHVCNEIFDKPDYYFNLKKLQKASGVNRRISVRELIEKAMGLIPEFKSLEELIEDEFQKFLLDQKPEEAERIGEMRYFFDAYIRYANVREIIDSGRFADLNVIPEFTVRNLGEVPKKWRKRIPEYVKDYVPLNRFL